MKGNYTAHVMMCVGIIVASTEAKRLLNKQKMEMRPVIGGFMLGIILFIIGSVHEPAGRAFAIIAVVSSLVTVASTKDKAAGISLADFLSAKTTPKG